MSSGRILVDLLAKAPITARFLRDEAGVTSIEYCLIASIVSIAAVGVMALIGVDVQTMTNKVVPGLQ